MLREGAALVSGDTAMMRRPKNLRWKASNSLPQVIPLKPEFPVCPICNRHVALEIAKVDEYGSAMHEECYLQKLQMKQDKPA